MFLSVINPFSTGFRSSFITDLYNHGKGIIVSAEYFTLKLAHRYSNDELKSRCRVNLKALEWNDNDIGEKVEIDCALRCYFSPNKSYEFRGRAKILNPTDIGLLSQPSGSFDEPKDPNGLILLEVASDPSNFGDKLKQLEKDLQILVSHHRVTLEETPICFAVLGISRSTMKKSEMDAKIKVELTIMKTMCPLLFRLYETDRFIRYYTLPNIKMFVKPDEDDGSECFELLQIKVTMGKMICEYNPSYQTMVDQLVEEENALFKQYDEESSSE